MVSLSVQETLRMARTILYTILPHIFTQHFCARRLSCASSTTKRCVLQRRPSRSQSNVGNQTLTLFPPIPYDRQVTLEAPHKPTSTTPRSSASAVGWADEGAAWADAVMCPRANACAAEWADAPVAMHDCLVGAPFAFAIRRQDGRRQGRRDAVEVAAHGGDDHSVLLRLLVGVFQQKHLSFLDVLTAT